MEPYLVVCDQPSRSEGEASAGVALVQEGIPLLSDVSNKVTRYDATH